MFLRRYNNSNVSKRSTCTSSVARPAAVITGSSTGIGRATAQLLAEQVNYSASGTTAFIHTILTAHILQHRDGEYLLEFANKKIWIG